MTETQTDFIFSPQLERKRTEKLSDEQTGNLLAAVGNSESKALTLIIMSDGNIYDRANLHRKLLYAQGENKIWKMDSMTPFGYCRDSFCPIGLVTKETLYSDLSTYGYQITEYGKEVGIPLVGLLLDFSERHKIPLGKLFGVTSSKSSSVMREGVEFRKRPPATTLKVLYELITSPHLPLREIDIIEALGGKNPSIEGSIQDTIHRLSEMGLIQYEAIEVNRRFSEYKISDSIPVGEPSIYKTQKTLTQLVLDVLKENKDRYLTREDIYNLLPEDIKKRNKPRSLYVGVANIPAHLARNGYATLRKFGLKKQSELNLTIDQRVLLTELLEVVYGLQNKNKKILEKGRMLAGRIIINPKKVQNLLRRVKEASSVANRLPIEETRRSILSMISAHPGTSNKEIYSVFREGGRLLGQGSIATITSVLEKEGMIKSDKKGNVKRYWTA